MRRKRDKFLFWQLFLLLPCVLLCVGCGAEDKNAAEETQEYKNGVFAMGTYMTLTAYGERAEDALALSEDKIRELEALWSVTDGALDPTVSPLITAWGFISGDYRIPDEDEWKNLLPYIDYKKVILEENSVILPDGMQLDLGAVGKGYTGDILSELLQEQGVTSALLDIGGNIQMVGRKRAGLCLHHSEGRQIV